MLGCRLGGVLRRSSAHRGLGGSATGAAVAHMVDDFRAYGHLLADLDPLGLPETRDRGLRALPGDAAAFARLVKHSDWTAYGAALDPNAALPGPGPRTVRELASVLRATYCGPVGVEAAHLPSGRQRQWIYERLERPGVWQQPPEVQRDVYHWLCCVGLLDAHLAKSFPMAKRFGIEGCDALIPALATVLNRAAELGVTHVELGMAHRGRLDVLASILRKPLGAIIREFAPRGNTFVGDVKYHLGTTVEAQLPLSPEEMFGPCATDRPRKTVTVSLSPNPSHLEAVDPVVMGRARAAIHSLGDNWDRVLALLVHGDASFCGQAILSETMQLSDLDAYTVHGAIHVIVNNQIGFTTHGQQ